ncbi:uncharacterized protein BJ212DRAFT_1321645 [Suillus subaureus]|uniref:Uncharacterized protein n=1 Tax=Suillus subaureus TaxID=48587 RepID=A0A9P7JIW3_9AGAM|nr:uncharacterized protein BJ212DRAFT_1321645 [Suillus subaureus]KAG1824654.1 hypothetical protein BJ212DRAFT_1321645 [Suillus subaureus]
MLHSQLVTITDRLRTIPMKLNKLAGCSQGMSMWLHAEFKVEDGRNAIAAGLLCVARAGVLFLITVTACLTQFGQAMEVDTFEVQTAYEMFLRQLAAPAICTENTIVLCVPVALVSRIGLSRRGILSSRGVADCFVCTTSTAIGRYIIAGRDSSTSAKMSLAPHPALTESGTRSAATPMSFKDLGRPHVTATPSSMHPWHPGLLYQLGGVIWHKKL